MSATLIEEAPPPGVLPYSSDQLAAELCRVSFEDFVRELWETVPGAGRLIWNWHLAVFCEELQAVAERVFRNEPKEHDLLCNVCPGSSKSTVWSILFQPWVWTRMPKARFICGSHTDGLVLELANKSRAVIKSDKYRKLFPEVVLQGDAAGYYTNTLGGDRNSCTVGGKSPTGKHAHFLVCLPYETPIITEAGEFPIGRVVQERMPVRVLGYDHSTGRPDWYSVEEYETNPPRPLVRVKFSAGPDLEATDDHPVYVSGKGYLPAADLIPGDEVIHALREDADPKKVFGLGKKVVVSVERTLRVLGAVYNLRVAESHNYFAAGVLVHNCDDPIDPKKALSAAELKTADNFMTQTLSSRKVRTEHDIAVTCLVMQRLHDEDPAGLMLKRSSRPGAAKVRHICLPGEITEQVSPPGLAAKYVNGLMDPVRLNRKVLDEQRAVLGEHGYAGQYLQKPVPPGGQMFKSPYFLQRVKAAPYRASRRIRYWDRASTSGAGCATAGVLLCRCPEGYYVEHVEHGHWEPHERNQRMLATALRDRARYGPDPADEPEIWVEAEGGSSGRDAWKAIARVLEGFRVREDRVTGDKVSRAEAWSSQCAALNVYLVDDGTWDVQGYVDEHCAFPFGQLKDRVDASTGAFNLMAGVRARGGLRVINFGLPADRSGRLRIVMCGTGELGLAAVADPALLLVFADPIMSPDDSPGRGEVMCNATETAGQVGHRFEDVTPALPAHACSKLLGSAVLSCYDAGADERHGDWGGGSAGGLLTASDCKKLWSVLLKKWDPPVKVLLVADAGGDDRRALSAALAVCDALRLPRSETLFRVGEPDWRAKPKDDAPNKHIYAAVRAGRNLVL